MASSSDNAEDLKDEIERVKGQIQAIQSALAICVHLDVGVFADKTSLNIANALRKGAVERTRFADQVRDTGTFDRTTLIQEDAYNEFLKGLADTIEVDGSE